MKKRTFTVEQIIQILAEGEKGNNTVESVCKEVWDRVSYVLQMEKKR